MRLTIAGRCRMGLLRPARSRLTSLGRIPLFSLYDSGGVAKAIDLAGDGKAA